MMHIKQSICYPMFKPQDMSIEELCGAAAEIGYAAIEFWGRDDEHEHVIATAKRHGLAVASMCGHESLTDGMNKRSNHDRIEAELIASIDYAARHGILGVICFSGNRNPDQPDDDAVDACAQCLKRAAPYAEKNAVNLNMELLNSRVDHPGYQCDHTAWGVAVCQKVNSPAVKLLYDIYHMQIMEGDVIRTIRDNIQWIGHFHTAGNPGRRDFDDDQELNYRGICKAIAQTGYDLYVGHEFRPKGDPIAALRTAFNICNVT